MEKQEQDVEDRKQLYGFCKRSKQWVRRDAMLGLHIKAYHADGTETHLSMRFAPEAFDDFLKRLKEYEWENILRTEEDIRASGEAILEVVPATTTDTEAWYRARHATQEDDVIVVRAAIAGLRRVTSLESMQKLLQKAIPHVQPCALLSELRELRDRLPRWDAHVTKDLDAREIFLREFPRQSDLIDVMILSADQDQALIVSILEMQGKECVRIDLIDHDRSELARRKLGLLRDEQPVNFGT